MDVGRVLKLTNRHARTLDNAVARWQADNLAPLMVAAGEEVLLNSRSFALALEELGRPTRAQIQRMALFEGLMLSTGSSIYAVMQAMKGNLAADLPSFAAQGSEAMMERFVEAGGEETEDVPLVGGLISADNLLSRLYMLPDAVQLVLEEYLLDRLPYSRDPTQTVEDAVEEAFAAGLVWSLAVVDIILTRAYRVGEQAVLDYRPELLEGWLWWAQLDSRTCPSCVAVHGSIFPVEEPFADHPRGRCMPIPIIRGFSDVWMENIETGDQWLRTQPPDVQRDILGYARYNAWRQGAVDLSQFSIVVESPAYGPIRRAASLREVLGDEAQHFYKRYQEW